VVPALAVLAGIGFTVAPLIGWEEETRDDDADGIPDIHRRTGPRPADATSDGRRDPRRLVNGAGSLLPVVVVAAALMIRAAIGELRRPGSVRRQWASATSGPAVAAGLVAAVAVALTGWSQAGAVALAWAALAGALVAFLVGRPANRP
jgi:multisubunit Na+/H+ antiporter MnhG subunit